MEERAYVRPHPRGAQSGAPSLRTAPQRGEAGAVAAAGRECRVGSEVRRPLAVERAPRGLPRGFEEEGRRGGPHERGGGGGEEGRAARASHRWAWAAGAALRVCVCVCMCAMGIAIRASPATTAAAAARVRPAAARGGRRRDSLAASRRRSGAPRRARATRRAAWTWPAAEALRGREGTPTLSEEWAKGSRARAPSPCACTSWRWATSHAQVRQTETTSGQSRSRNWLCRSSSCWSVDATLSISRQPTDWAPGRSTIRYSARQMGHATERLADGRRASDCKQYVSKQCWCTNWLVPTHFDRGEGQRSERERSSDACGSDAAVACLWACSEACVAARLAGRDHPG